MNEASRTSRPRRSARVRFQPSDLYKIRICRSQRGEHIPLLVAADSGLPLVRPNQYVLVARRDRCQVAVVFEGVQIRREGTAISVEEFLALGEDYWRRFQEQSAKQQKV